MFPPAVPCAPPPCTPRELFKIESRTRLPTPGIRCMPKLAYQIQGQNWRIRCRAKTGISDAGPNWRIRCRPKLAYQMLAQSLVSAAGPKPGIRCRPKAWEERPSETSWAPPPIDHSGGHSLKTMRVSDLTLHRCERVPPAVVHRGGSLCRRDSL